MIKKQKSQNPKDLRDEVQRTVKMIKRKLRQKNFCFFPLGWFVKIIIREGLGGNFIKKEEKMSRKRRKKIPFVAPKKRLDEIAGRIERLFDDFRAIQIQLLFPFVFTKNMVRIKIFADRVARRVEEIKRARRQPILYSGPFFYRSPQSTKKHVRADEDMNWIKPQDSSFGPRLVLGANLQWAGSKKKEGGIKQN